MAPLLAASCEKVIDIDPGDIERQVVVMADVEADSLVSLRLSYSRFLLDTRPFASIGGATVTLAADGATVASQASGSDGRCSLPFAPQPGQRLDLTVSVAGHAPVTATTVVPQAPVAEGLRLSGLSRTTFHFRLVDPADEDNYYGLRILAEERLEVSYRVRNTAAGDYDWQDSLRYDTLTVHYPITVSCNDPNITDPSDPFSVVEDDGAFTGKRIALSDAAFNGTAYDFALDLENSGDGYSARDKIYDRYSWPDTATVDIRSLTTSYSLEATAYSHDRYLHELTLDAYDDDAILQFFSEPVQVHCNIDGGIGIFAALTHIILPFDE